MALKQPARSANKKATSKPVSKSRKGGKKASAFPSKLLFSVVLVGALLISGALSYAQYQMKQPEAVLKQALANSLQAESVAVGFQMIDRSQGQPDATWRMLGSVLDQGQFDLAGSYEKDGKVINLDLRSADGKDAYLRMGGLANLPSLLGEDASLYGISATRNPITGLDGRWLVIPSDIKNTIIQNRPVNESSSLALTAEEEEVLVEAYSRHEFLKISKILAEEPVDSVDSFHYQLTADSANLGAFLVTVQERIERMKLTQDQIDAAVRTVASAGPIDVWISKDDKRLSKISYVMASKDGTDSVELTMSGYNQSTVIEPPTESTPLLEALTGLNL